MWKMKFGRCIYTSPSGCKVYQNLLYRWLTFSSPAWQTVVNRYRPSNPVLHYLKALSLMLRAKPGSSCILGLGGAAIPHMLNKRIPGHSMVVVDSSLDVIQIAKKYFKADKIPNLTIINQNASDFMRQSTTKFPHILVDLYDAHHLPDECQTIEFFQNCRNRLTDNGFMAINLANPDEQLSVVLKLKKVFPICIIITVPKCNNMVVIVPNNDDKDSFINTIKETKELKRITWSSPWGYIGLS